MLLEENGISMEIYTPEEARALLSATDTVRE